MKKRWHYLNKKGFPQNGMVDLAHPVLLQVMTNRGLTEKEKIVSFLNPSLEHFSNLEDIPCIKDAAQYILDFIKTKKKITIYGDYDVDGVTSTVLLYEALTELGAVNIDYYIPHRFTEGYGLNNAAIDKLNAQGTELIITVDCGVSNYDEVQHAKELGLNIVITDHHLPPVVCPNADFVVNPKTNNKTFAARDAAGVGVAFKLAEQLFRLQGFPPNSKTKKFLDLVSLGTIADIVPLLKENRLLTVLGLDQLNHFSRVGIKSLARISNVQNKVTTRDVGFGLAPRINAAGRMDHAKLSAQLLLAKNYQEAKKLAQQLNQLNIQRQNAGSLIMTEVEAQISNLPDLEQRKVLIFSSQNWHPGIIGIVASQIVRKYNRPTVLIAEYDGSGRGSIRSLEGLDIFEPLSKCGYLLKDFGGHKEAAGFEIAKDKIFEFQEEYTKIINDSVRQDDLMPILDIEMELKSKDISFSLAQELQKLAPFGQGNRIPVFSTKELAIIDFRKIGGGKHLKLTFSDGNRLIDGIAFGQGDLFDVLLHGNRFELAFSLDINEWNGERKLQLNIKDIREYAEAN